MFSINSVFHEPFLCRIKVNLRAKKDETKFHVHLSVKQNLKLIEEPQSNVNVAAMCMEYGWKKQTLANITQKSCVFSNIHYLLMQKALAIMEKVAEGNIKP